MMVPRALIKITGQVAYNKGNIIQSVVFVLSRICSVPLCSWATCMWVIQVVLESNQLKLKTAWIDSQWY